jgi:predicted nucleic acid-binding protein
MSLFLDTNVVVYAFDRSDPAKQRIAQAVLDSTERLVVSTQVLLETWWVLTRKLAAPLDEQTASDVIRELSLLPVVQADTALVTRAIETARRWQLTVWDAMILEAASSAACSHVLTEDLQHGQIFDGVTIDNPFARD